MFGLSQNAKYAYLLSITGVGVIALTAIFGAVRAMMFRPAFRVAVNGTRPFSGQPPGVLQYGTLFGLMSILTVLGIIIAIVGLAWLGLSLKQANKTAS